jgi:hypothetical protein
MQAPPSIPSTLLASLPSPPKKSRDDVKEAERVKLNEEIKKIGVWWNTNHPDVRRLGRRDGDGRVWERGVLNPGDETCDAPPPCMPSQPYAHVHPRMCPSPEPCFLLGI